MRVVHWTDEALDQALAIREYLNVTSPSYAAQMVDKLFERVNQLVAFPYMGPVYKLAKLPQVRELLMRPYRVIYEVTDRQIRVMAVLHQHQG